VLEVVDHGMLRKEATKTFSVPLPSAASVGSSCEEGAALRTKKAPGDSPAA
jgi:hypothetical protein